MDLLYFMLQRDFIPPRGRFFVSESTSLMKSLRSSVLHRSSPSIYHIYVNIFVLSEDPAEAARMQCDKHVCQMILESGTLLCTAHPQGVAPWRRSHYHHPCAVWVRASRANYEWLAVHGLELCAEYTRRYGRVHAAEDVLIWCAENVPEDLPDVDLTPFVVVIKDPTLRGADPVSSYRAYYLRDKRRFAKWKCGDPPPWWVP